MTGASIELSQASRLNSSTLFTLSKTFGACGACAKRSLTRKRSGRVISTDWA